MTYRMIYNSESPEGKKVAFTESEEAELIERQKIVTKNIEDFKLKLEKQESDKKSGNKKLKDLGLTDDEINALIR